MSAFRLTRLGSIAPVTLLLALFPSLAHAQAPVDAAPNAAGSEPAAPTAAASTPEDAKAPAAPSAVAVPAAERASTPEDAKADAAAEAAAAAAATEATSSGSNEESDQVKLNLYGFTDFTYSLPIGHFDFAPQNSSFAVGKLNLYAAANLGSNWRSLAEVRFMYLPNGSAGSSQVSPGAAPPRIDTTVGDYSDHNRPVKWGGISIERAWLEHTFHPALTVRAGAFLTPYGIWNVDHGSPAIISVSRPFIIGESLFPEHQTGVEVYGAWNLGPSQVGYHVTLSNGRGPIDTYQDLDKNKAVGGRLFFKHDASKWGTLTLGASGYKGTYTDSYTAVTPNLATGSVTVTHPVTAQYKELSLAADAKWELGGLLVQSEFVMNDTAYPDDLRPAVPPVGDGAPGFAPDYRRYGVYGLAGYRFPLLGIMPFAGAEYYDNGLYTSAPPVSAAYGGVNVRPIARVVLKAQFTHVWFAKWQGPEFGHIDNIDLQAAWSF